MADYTSVDYALSYGQNDPLYDMLRRRLRDRVSSYMQGAANFGLGRLEARGLGQSGAVERTLGQVSGQGLNALATGEAGIAQRQAAERFALLQDAIRREAAKPGFWDVFTGLAGAAGTFLPYATGISSLLRKKGGGGDIGSFTSGEQVDSPIGDEDEWYG